MRKFVEKRAFYAPQVEQRQKEGNIEGSIHRSRSDKMGSTRYTSDREEVLDELLIRSIEKLDSIIALRNELNRYMETGMIDLARARYATGGSRSSISSLSFNLAHMEASKRVSIDRLSPSLASSWSGLGGHGDRGGTLEGEVDGTTRFRLESAPARSPPGDIKQTLPVTAISTTNPDNDQSANDNGNKVQQQQQQRVVKVPEVEPCNGSGPTYCGNEADADHQEGNAQLRRRQVASFRSSGASMDERDSFECSDPGAPGRSSLESPTTSVVVKGSGGGGRREAASSSISGYSSDNRASSDSTVTNSRTDHSHCRHTGDDSKSTMGSGEQLQRTTTVNASNNNNNPLRWFGVLVPNSLRSSKECFDRALEILTEVASQQNELAHLLDTFQRLQKLQTAENSANSASKKEQLTI